MIQPSWLDVDTLIRLHDQGLARYGGPSGLRDAGLLESALQRPANRWAYERIEGIPALAATYAVAIAKNHPFVDGNKRAAFLALVLFLRRNGSDLKATNDEAIAFTLAVASSECDLLQAEAWVTAHTVRWRRST